MSVSKVLAILVASLCLFACDFGSNPADSVNIDYSMVSWSPPAEGVTGSAISGDFSFQNSGASDGGEMVAWELYVSADAVFDAGDTLAGSGTTGALAAKAASSAVTFPGQLIPLPRSHQSGLCARRCHEGTLDGQCC